MRPLFLLLAAFTLGAAAGAGAEGPAMRPNLLWITSEDHGPHLGCYGDRYATTPHIDRLAARGMIYRHAWSNAPVCAPARTTIISGMYPPSTGAEHMRSMVAYPAGKQMFPQFLRAAGYYCTNNAKEDYNLAKPGQVWDDSSGSAHWRNRASGQPFFAVFNSEKSHESRIRVRPHPAVHDPAGVRVPAYHPDTPEVRQDWAQYYDSVSEADADAGRRLQELADAGLAEETIVFYYADRDPAALPELQKALADDDSAVRCWAALGLLIRGERGVAAAGDAIRAAREDRSGFVRVSVAQALAQYGNEADRQPALAALAALAQEQRDGPFVALAALNAIDELGPTAAPLRALLKAEAAKRPLAAEAGGDRYAAYVPRLLDRLATKP